MACYRQRCSTCFCVLCGAVAGKAGGRQGGLGGGAVRVAVLSHRQQRAQSPLPREPVSGEFRPLRRHLPVNLQGPKRQMLLAALRHGRKRLSTVLFSHSAQG